MERDANARFRITVWPQRPLPQPSTPAFRSYAVHSPTRALLGRPSSGIPGGDELAAAAGAPDRGLRWTAPRGTWPELDGETYLRLADVDLQDIGSVLGFVNAYGVLGTRRRGQDPDESLLLKGFTLEPGAESVIDELLGVRARAAAHFDVDEVFIDETLDEFVFGAACLRDLLTAWRVASGELEHAAAEWISPVWSAPATRERLNSSPWEPGGPQRLLAGYLTDGLRWFAPQVFANPYDDDDYDEAVRPFDNSDPPLYDICCLELFNHISERVPYRRCQNEPCGRLFVRQSGRALHGQHRSRGVIYCSSSCARAQAQRAHRRRAKRSSAQQRD